MTRNQVEHIKTGLLFLLVIMSFVFSGYLWYSTPASETIRPDNDLPPYIFKNPIYSNRERHELIAPSQIILHQKGNSSLVLPDESSSSKNMEHLMHQLNVIQLREVHTTKEAWQTLALGTGVELLFLQDTSLDLVEAFFGKTIEYQGSSSDITAISRIWVFRDGSKVKAWFISDKNQQIAEAGVDLAGDQLEKVVKVGNKGKVQKVIPMALQGPLPWEANTASFSRVFYLPSPTIHGKRLAFQVENINIDNMKQWLFRDPDIKPLIPNRDESFYMYNDQLLNYNNKFNYMTYSDSSSQQDDEEQTLPNQLDQMKNFMQRHQGWTGYYVLDGIQNDDLYVFRLFKEGYPVFWTTTDAIHNIHPDVIQLQTGDNGVSKYIRSMHYLSGKPTIVATVSLPGKEQITRTLLGRGIPLGSVSRIYPGYVAKETMVGKIKQIVLDPVWVVTKTDGKREFIQ